MALPHTILSRFWDIARQFPDAVAIEGATTRLTYRQLDSASRLLESDLTRAGVGPGCFVPILAARSPGYIASVLAILRCGAAYAPIDPESPVSRREAMLRPLNASCGVARGALALPAGYRTIDPSEAIERVIAGEMPSHAPPRPEHDPEAPAYVMYTSGSTGEPKGVVVPHRAVVRLVVDADFAEMKPGMRWAVMSAIAFDASTLEIWAPLLNGGTCVIQDTPFPALDALATFFTDRSIDCAWLTATLFNAIVDRDCRSLRGLQQLLTGGERESVSHMREFTRHCPNTRLIHGYGPTENTTFSLCHTVRESDLTTGRIPIGTPIRGTIAKITPPGDFETSDAPDGELLVGGDGLALGYLGKDALTRERFVTDGRGTRWYRTGDLVSRLPDGSVLYKGRIDRQVKIRGHRVEPEEVENALFDCPGVRQAAVIVMGSESADRHLVGFYSPSETISDSSVRDFLSTRLPPNMVPSLIVGLSELPRGSTGKIDRDALRDRMASDARSRSETAEPADATEAQLLGLVRSRVPRADSIGMRSNFYRIGGHSLLAMRLAADIQDSFGARVSPLEILTLPDLRAISNRIEQQRDEPSPNEPSVDAAGLRIGHVRQLLTVENERDPTGRSMLVHQAWIVRPGIDSDRLERVWRAIVDRHTALRTKLQIGTMGLTASQADPSVEKWFFDEGPLDHAESVLRSSIPDEVINRIGAPLPTGSMPVRLHHWKLPEDRSLVVAVFLHSAIDEWSLDILQNELCQLLDGRDPGSIHQYALFTEYEDRWIDRDRASMMASRVLDAPRDQRTLPEVRSRSMLISEFPATTSAAITQRLDEISARTGTGEAAVALRFFGASLRERFGSPGRFVLTPVSKRVRPELQNVVGCCLDMQLIDTAPADQLNFQSIHQQIRDAQTETVLPIEEVVELVRDQCPAAAADVTRFGFTYRLIDRSEVKCSEHTLSPLAIPQLAARFAIALHIERRDGHDRVWLEASRDSVSESQLARFASDLEQAIRSGAHKPSIASDTTPTAEPQIEAEQGDQTTAHQLQPRTVEVLRSLWEQEVGRPPDPSVDFLAQGGSSLKAMRLAAAIHDRTGMKLHVGEFLIKPTFANLTNWTRNDPERPYSQFRVCGRSPGTTVLGFPGSSGRAIDLHAFWTHYSREVEHVDRMIGFDLVSMAGELSVASTVSEIADSLMSRATSIALEQNPDRPIELIGYSLGGLIALGVANELTTRGVDVRQTTLIDAYPPPFLCRSPELILAKINAQLRNGLLWNTVRAKLRLPKRGSLTDPDANRRAADHQQTRPLWQHIHRALRDWQVPVVSTPVCLVQSAPLTRSIRPLRYRTTNGLAPFCSQPIRVTRVDVGHLEMLTSGSRAVAEAAASFHDRSAVAR